MKISRKLFIWYGLFTSHIICAHFIFEYFPALTKKIPYVKLTTLPTPAYYAQALSQELGRHLFIKNDSATGLEDLYGGNKVRKLEFLLGDALEKNATKIITFGCVGSNHALATACYADHLGIPCLLLLKHQPASPVVQNNLLLDRYFKADIEIFSTIQERQKALDALLKERPDYYFFPTGGSTGLGALGYVNAAFELAEQIKNGSIVSPDFIYLPIGSCGTAAGLLLGLKLAKINSKIIAVAVEGGEFTQKVKFIFEEANIILNRACPEIPLVPFSEDQLYINRIFAQRGYGVWIPEGNTAMELMQRTQGIQLEGTYSAKAFAALIDDIKHNKIPTDASVLFWNTYCGDDFSHLTSTIDYRTLPEETHRYFETR